MKLQLDIFLGRFPIEQLKRKGTDCPWCARKVIAYGYDLDHKLIARALTIADFTDLTEQKWWPKEVFKGTDTEFNKLKYWHIIEKAKSQWKLTKTGINFLQKKIPLPKKIWVYDDTVILKEDELINVEMVEPRWKFHQAHWKNDYVIYPSHAGQTAFMV